MKVFNNILYTYDVDTDVVAITLNPNTGGPSYTAEDIRKIYGLRK